MKTIQSIEFSWRTLNDDGTHNFYSKLIYSRTVDNPFIRGGVQIEICNPDDNSFTLGSLSYSIYSQCMTPKTNNGVIYFGFDFSIDSYDGNFFIDELSNSGATSSEGTLENCFQ
ncbi:MAG: hypothetical protein HOO06_08865 [Bdellovibrionaceae bacterium]|jgi:hypothetical protein|nr:hypothetical protein [Pseudobdellovibrionaceae bacterium]